MANQSLESLRTSHAHELAGVKARMRRVLDGQLRQLVRDGRDALQIDPPRPDFAVGFLDDALAVIDATLAGLSQ